MSVGIRQAKVLLEKQKTCQHEEKDVTQINNKRVCANCMKVLGDVKN